ncbi:hypothetical protein [Chryseobacterium gambrini]|uniref:hypothetical protein n=1 Tax=Chryseobacterium gambrini TaxID=373672 RepID=UPI0022F3818C|nr:hypothetical protein [Chryseobacterium gambrini]WBX99105.1 hypothetical protein PE065_07580 [Chryseobacterium gambrini]
MKKILLTISSLIAVFSSAQIWNTAGNSGTNSSTDFLGTIDAQPLIFRTNNSEKVRITLNGSVGVGTSAPTQKLDVNGSVIANERYNNGNDGSYYIKLNSNGYNIPIISYLESSGNTLFFGNPGGQYHSKTIIQGGNGDVVLEPHSASSAFVVKAGSGNVGVGTTTPDNVQNWDKVLDIYASAHSKLLVRSLNVKTGIFSHETWGGAVGRIGTESNHDLRLMAGYGNDVMTLNTIGNVGIGINNPLGKLHIGDNSNAGVIIDNRLTSVSAKIPAQIFWSESGNGSLAGDLGIAPRTDIGGSILFYTNNGTDINQRMKIAANGNIGIGINNPSRKLTVNGDIYGVAASSLTFQDDVRFTVTNANVPSLSTSLNTFSMPQYGIAAPNTSGSADLWISGNNGIRMFTNGNPNPQFNLINGNVGIGNITPQAKLDVSGDVRIANIPTSTSSTDQALVVDAQGFVKRGTITNSLQSNNIYNNILYYHSGCAVINNGVKIKTNIPFPASGSGGEMPTVNIEGFAYGESKTIGININWYVWQNEFYLASNVSSYGGYTPIVKLANENGKVVIFLDDKTYCINFGVKAIGGGDPSYYQGWTIADEPITGSITKTLAYKNAFGNVKVDGKLEAKEIKVTLTPTADFVFEKEYGLPKLEEVEKFVKENKHLPEIASAKEMEKEGVNVGEFQIKLLQKIEELTLYSIDLNKKNKEQEALIKSQTDILKSLNKRLEKIEKTKQK